jgi:hypothetical protein
MKKSLLFFSFLLFIFLSANTTETIAQTRKAVRGAEVTGTFRDKVSGSEFKILALGKGKLRVNFSGVYNFKMANGEPMANMGEASGEAEITSDTAIFKPADTEQCTMTMKFLTGGRLKVSQKGTDAECGFGVNVSASGDYKKTSSAKPKFAAQ